MTTEQQETGNSFPSHEIDSREKGYDWVKQWTMAAFNEARGFLGTSMYFGSAKYREIRRNGMGKQSINKYKRIYGIDEQNNETFMTVDWSPVAIASKYREIAISLISQKLFDFQITAVDPLSKVEQDKYFQSLYIKMAMRKAAEAANSPLANSPALKRQQGEPEDEEELEMEKQFGFKHNLAMKMELGCSYIHDTNNVSEQRLITSANLFDFGFGGYKDWVDEQGIARYRAVNPENFVCSYCSKADFTDMQYAGEIIEPLVIDLAPYFTKEQMKLIAKAGCGKYGNPTTYSINPLSNNYFGNFKIHVWDAVFYSYNDTAYRNEVNENGNLKVVKTDYQNLRPSMSAREVQYQGKQYPEFMSAKRKVIYKTKWIIGTDFMYDWGLMENQKRNKDTWWDTVLPYRMYAWNFDHMNFTGITERLIPVIDDWHRTYYKLQDIKNKLIPYIMNLNMSALEAAGFAGKGGTKLKPDELLDLILQNFVAPFRETDLFAKNNTGKAAWFEQTGQLEIVLQYRTELQNIERLFMSITGLNDVTNGNTPDPRNLTPNIEAAVSSTNNCLYLVSRAEKQLFQRLTEGIIGDIQLAVQNGNIEGYTMALGSNAVQYFQLTQDVAFRKFGLFVTDAPTPAERQAFASELQIKDANGMIQPEDKIIIMECRNFKEASERLAYSIKKRQDIAHQQQIEQSQAQAKAQTDGLLQLEQVKQKNAIELLQAQIQLENVKGEWNYRTEIMKKGSDMQEGAQQAQAKVISSQIMADAKIHATHLQAGTSLAQTHMDNQNAVEVAKHKKTA